MPKLEFLFDVNLVASIRIKADSLSVAKRKLSELLDCASANLGADSDGNPVIAEVSLDPDFGPTFVSVDDCPVSEANAESIAYWRQRGIAIHQDSHGNWRWVEVDTNGKPIRDPSQPFQSCLDCVLDLHNLFDEVE